MNFANLPDKPHGLFQDLALDQTSPSERDRSLKSNYTTLILNAAGDNFPYLKNFKDFYCSEIEGHKIYLIVEETVKDSLISIQVCNEEVKTLYVLKLGKKTALKPMDTGYVQKYGHTLLQVGVLFMEILDVIHRSDRARLLGCLKYMMLMFKSHNSRSKYALEILHLICYQQAPYSLCTVYMAFCQHEGEEIWSYTSRKSNGTPCKRTKKMLQLLDTMNKDKILLARSKGVAIMYNIADNFDSVSDIRKAQAITKRETLY
ncbi:hypothetical protein CHS0354_001353 [Potamilus streckersoni]|uniref:Uncharacterized protein n=1 Tax=Potamilus streckersoni TaxID=2493646 RepID=A0AAE0TGA1_9BIVA|nr:hypothetical protein CHS0354_001353 [Potamilus streckersoni]